MTWIFSERPYAPIALACMSLILGIILLYLGVLRKNTHAQTVASSLLISLLFLGGCSIIAKWGIVNPYGVVLFGLIIVMSGILLGARYALFAAIAITLTYLLFEYARYKSYVIPDTSWISSPSSIADVVNLGTMFFVTALVSWLFNKRMEESLERARRSEKALKKERDLLEIKVEERTRALQEAQLEKVKQFYKFAELGRLSTALFHDLAGSLSSLSLDIESMRSKGRADFTKRIDSNIHYIDSVVQRVRSQIQGKDNNETFDIIAETKDLVGILSYNARKVRTKLEFQTERQPILFTGNVTHFRQLIINLLSNAIEAYSPVYHGAAKDRPVVIHVSQTNDTIIIKVTDHGKGISESTREKIFDPFYTTKSSGTGIGLFIVQQVAEKDFGGTISVTSSPKAGTTFVVTIPK